GRRFRQFVFLFNEANDVLEDHDRIINEDAHRQRQTEQRHVVQRKVHRFKQRKRCDDRRWNRKRCNQNRPKITYEQQDDEAREEAALKAMFFQRLDGSVNKDRFVRNDLDVDARRQTFTDLIELASDEVDGCNRVRAGLATNVELYGLFAIHHIPGG